MFPEATMKTIHEYGPVVEGDEITLECVTLLKPAVITWTPANSIPQFIQKSSTKHLAGMLYNFLLHPWISYHFTEYEDNKYDNCRD